VCPSVHIAWIQNHWKTNDVVQSHLFVESLYKWQLQMQAYPEVRLAGNIPLMVLHFFFFVVLEFELRVSCLPGRPSTTIATPLALFHFSYLSNRVSCFSPRADFKPRSSYPCLLHSWGYRCEPSYLLICWNGIFLSFCPGWPQTSPSHSLLPEYQKV
jgi:hypothetical protein